MPYNVHIQSDKGEPLKGTLYLYADGVEIGQAGISLQGSELTDEDIAGADFFRALAPGYNHSGTSYLYDDTVFTLSKKPPIGLYVGIGIAAGYWLFKKF